MILLGTLVFFLALFQTALPGTQVNLHTLKDLSFVHTPTFNCSDIGLHPQGVVEEQHYHTFPSHSNLKNSCQSRYQQHCFRKNTTPKFFPPPKFLSVLREYEAYHERCTRGFNLTSLAIDGKVPQNCTYLVWKSMDGMGNQLLSLVCAFIYSLLTNRAMLIATDSHIEQYFCNPFPFSSWVLPEEFPEAQLRSAAKRLFVYVNEIEKKEKSACTVSNNLPKLIAEAPKHLQVFISCCDEARDHQFFCPTAQKLLSGVNWMFYQSHEYTLPAFYFVPEFRSTLNDWFPQKDVFMHGARYLLNPTNGLWSRITDVYKSQMDGAERQIGFQVRSWSGSYVPSVSKQILRCGVEQKLLPRPLEHVGASEVAMEKHRQRIAVMVASLRSEYQQDLAADFANFTNSEGSLVNVFTASQEGSQKTGDRDHDEKAIIDIWLLSFMHDMVITPFSTFGSCASGLAGTIPLLFMNYEQDKLNEPACGRSNVAGPCFIKYPWNRPCYLDPARSSIFDPGFMLPEIKYCDLNPGLSIYAGH